MLPAFYISFFFFFNDTATTEIYTLSLHDALPIFQPAQHVHPRIEVRLPNRPAHVRLRRRMEHDLRSEAADDLSQRSEEHTSELQSRLHLVCRLLLEKKKKKKQQRTYKSKQIANKNN